MLKMEGEGMLGTIKNAIRRDLLLVAICFSVLCAVQVWGQSPNLVRSRSSLRSEDGLQRLLFAFPAGRLVVNLPDDIRPGDTISGTVSREPEGTDNAEREKNLGILNGMVIDLGGEQKFQADRPRFTWLPKMPPSVTQQQYILRIVAIYSGTEQIAAVNVPLNLSTLPGPTAFTLPTLGQTGRNLSIPGLFDGDIGTTKCAIGGADCEILAESPRKIVFSTPTTVVGQKTISVSDGKVGSSGNFRNIGIDLTAPKTSLLKGEKTTRTVRVVGLEDIKEPVPVRLVTTGAVTVDGGNDQTISIAPGQVRSDGSFSLTRQLTGTAAGAFNVTATLLGPPG
jgi:hypothetical protein